ncbi:hypothetical protein Mp_2g23740 [Marchantia polymorpha subsp. ruderalis]|uniref:Uncharacterized protein n=1 Tax=Marchantia polymorpha TaxID=3197 RepID=A0A2R6WP90_MARPO|nr:hypothetical protein MARPO_0069s0024 [Marchantia polymorpha]BBN03470.1 hypothetical protein Mp_2g23740 [Marchantia polymorpha subsp. ruderalis]|eukprot:PTQ35677.1 hypothetical protein MARPO_0069s0024 [Marchantia polymorpha]
MNRSHRTSIVQTCNGRAFGIRGRVPRTSGSVACHFKISSMALRDTNLCLHLGVGTLIHLPPVHMCP